MIRDYINRTDSKLGELENEVKYIIKSDKLSTSVIEPIQKY